MENNLEILENIMKPYFDKKKEIENVPVDLQNEKDEASNKLREMKNERTGKRKELEKERKVVLEEISKDLNTPAKKVYNNLNDMMYNELYENGGLAFHLKFMYPQAITNRRM